MDSCSDHAIPVYIKKVRYQVELWRFKLDEAISQAEKELERKKNEEDEKIGIIKHGN